MKMMKKIMMLLLVLMFVFAMTACGEKDDDSSSKKGSSRKKDDTEQNVTTPTEDPDPTAEPTDKPEPTAEPVITDTPTPTEKPADPTPTPVIGGGELSYDLLKGQWSGEKTLEPKEFMSEYMGLAGTGSDDAEIMNLLFDSMKKSGIDSKIYLEMRMNFTSDEDCSLHFSMDATEFGVAIKKFFSDVDNVYAFYAEYMGMDVAAIKDALIMSGMTEAQLVSMLSESMEEAFDMDELNQTEDFNSTYEIRDGRIYLDNDEAAYFVYDEAKNTIIIRTTNATSDEMAFVFSFLEGLELTK